VAKQITVDSVATLPSYFELAKLINLAVTKLGDEWLNRL